MKDPKYKIGDDVTFMTSPNRPAKIINITNSGTERKPMFLYGISEWAGDINRIPEESLRPLKK